LLVPTELELAAFPDAPDIAAARVGEAEWRDYRVALCGFGPVDAAVGAMAALARCGDVELCVLAGLAGTLDADYCAIGDVVEAATFRLHDFETAALPVGCRGAHEPTSIEEGTVFLDLEWMQQVELLTVTSPAADAATAAARREAFPEARAEEMEGYSVARAARALAVPFTCLRAISNVAGEREGWDVKGAVAALAERLAEVGAGS
jgi:futalosine hydrolase